MTTHEKVINAFDSSFFNLNKGNNGGFGVNVESVSIMSTFDSF